MHNAEALFNLISVDKKLKKTTETEPPSAKVSINADPGSNKVTVLLAVLILTLSKFNHDLPYYCYMKICCLVVNKSNIRFMFALQHLEIIIIQYLYFVRAEKISQKFHKLPPL